MPCSPLLIPTRILLVRYVRGMPCLSEKEDSAWNAGCYGSAKRAIEDGSKKDDTKAREGVRRETEAERDRGRERLLYFD